RSNPAGGARWGGGWGQTLPNDGPSLLRSVETRGGGVLTQLRIPCTGKVGGGTPSRDAGPQNFTETFQDRPARKAKGNSGGAVVMPRSADPLHVRRLGKRVSGCTARTSAPFRPPPASGRPCGRCIPCTLKPGSARRRPHLERRERCDRPWPEAPRSEAFSTRCGH